MPLHSRRSDVTFEDTFEHEIQGNAERIELMISNRPLFILGVAVFLLVASISLRILLLNVSEPGFYAARAQVNASQISQFSAPRGLITDRTGIVIAKNKTTFSVVLDTGEFARSLDLQAKTLQAAEKYAGISSAEILALISKRTRDQIIDPLVLASDITPSQVVEIKAAAYPALSVVSGFEREYPDGAMFSSVVGYTNLAGSADIRENPKLSSRDSVGRVGIEASYDGRLRGTPGMAVSVRDAQGKILGEQDKGGPRAGDTLVSTIDAGFQKYAYTRMTEGLRTLGRTAGGFLAIDTRTGDVLSLISFPTYDNGTFTSSGSSQMRSELLNSPGKPLFNRVISGQYNPGSTIKPLVGIAALAENVISSVREIFSPGYLDIPNPYNPEAPTRYEDWRYQGNVNLATALAYSSNVYFYTVGGGAGDMKGLGITKLRQWWEKFKFGSALGIDIPGERKGFLPSPEWKEDTTKRPWLLGDTYNVSIGQGDLLVTPLQLLSYIGAVANGGTVLRPRLVYNTSTQPVVLSDLTALQSQIHEAQKGMREGVINPRGTSYRLHDLPFAVAAKTGSAQVKNNTQENAFFVGYGPYESSSASSTTPQIAVLVMIENSKEGSLNAVPIARDIFDWYYWNRIKNKE